MGKEYTSTAAMGMEDLLNTFSGLSEYQQERSKIVLVRYFSYQAEGYYKIIYPIEELQAKVSEANCWRNTPTGTKISVIEFQLKECREKLEVATIALEQASKRCDNFLSGLQPPHETPMVMNTFVMLNAVMNDCKEALENFKENT